MSEQKQRSKDIIRTANIAESAYPRLKICGLSRPCDIEWVNDAGVDFAGFVFARSRRQVSPEQAKQLHSMLKKEIPAVGVFVNETIETIVGLVEDGVIDWVQLHGQEDEAYINELKSKVSCPGDPGVFRPDEGRCAACQGKLRRLHFAGSGQRRNRKSL